MLLDNDASSREKVVWSESGEKSAQIKHRLQAKTALNKYVAGFCCERQQEMDFFTGGSIIMDYGLVFWPEVMVWRLEIKLMDLFLTNMQLLASQDVNWWTGVVWIIVMFLSAVWTHSDGTHSLQRNHWWASDGMLHFSKSDEETTSSFFR